MLVNRSVSLLLVAWYSPNFHFKKADRWYLSLTIVHEKFNKRTDESSQSDLDATYRWIKAKKVSEILLRLACLSLQNSRNNLKYFAQITGSLASPPWNLLLI